MTRPKKRKQPGELWWIVTIACRTIQDADKIQRRVGGLKQPAWVMVCESPQRRKAKRT